MLTRNSASRLVLVASLLAACAPSTAREFILRSWPASKAAPALRLADVSGRAWDLRSLRGKPVLLNFWATWCEPCAAEIPALAEIARKNGDDLVVLGVAYKESGDAVQRFVAAHPASYPMLLDLSGESFKQWTSGVLPTTVLVGRDGRPRWSVMGALDPQDPGFTRALAEVLAAPRR